MKLDGKVAIVTGGAMGNGLGIVKTFLKYGADVVIIDYSDKTVVTLKYLFLKIPLVDTSKPEKEKKEKKKKWV